MNAPSSCPLVGEIAAAVFLGHDSEQWMVVQSSFWIWADTSGHQKRDDPLVVAALISPRENWERFHDEWDTFLQAYQVPYLHMKELNPHPFIRPYRVWCDDQERRKAFLAVAVQITKKHVHKIITMHIDPKGYAEVNEQYDLNMFGPGAFPLTAVACAVQVKKWLYQKGRARSARYFQENGDNGIGLAVELSKKWKLPLIPVPAFDPNTQRWMTPFQPADMVAWEVAREWKENRSPNGRPRRKLLSEILRHLNPTITAYPKSSLLDLVKKFPNHFPRRA